MTATTTVAPHRTDVRLRLLEGFELTAGDQPRVLPPSAQRLVAFLALQPRPVMRSRAAGVLWKDRNEPRAAACLRSAIWRANAGHPIPVVAAGRSRIALGDHVAVDAREATRAAHDQLAGRGGPADLEVLTGSLLPGWYEDWVIVERERIRQLCLQALERRAQALLSAGKIDLAIEAALTVVSAEPLRESAYRLLIDGYLRCGNRGEALRQFEQCCAVLRDELGLPPSEALVRTAALAGRSVAGPTR